MEPRWHCWLLLSLLLFSATDFPLALLTHSAGLLLGGLCVLREPEVWLEGLEALRRRGFKAGVVLHGALLVVTLLFLPLTVGMR